MDLGLDIRTRGRAARPVKAEVVRPLRAADLALLEEERGVQAPSLLKRLSQRHHHLARLLAEGIAPGDAAVMAGYSSSRVSILSADPAFSELVAFYKRGVDEAFASMHERLAGLSVDAIDELQERLEDEPESFSNGLLLDIVSKTADRTGHGPSTSTTNVNVNVNLADKLEAARKRVEQYRTIEGKANDPTDLPDSG